jgi:hypothetical protein
VFRGWLQESHCGWSGVGAVREESTDGDAAERAATADHLFAVANGRLRSRTLAILRESYDRLARFERIGGSKLNSLRRLVLFGCFGLHVHALSRWNERNSERPRPPILLEFPRAVSRNASTSNVTP